MKKSTEGDSDAQHHLTADVTTERMGMLKKRRGKKTKDPFWKRRIKRNIGTWRKYLSTIEEVGRENI